MTPKEKSKELVEKYFPLVDSISKFNYSTDTNLKLLNAKQCALIAVDEIIKTDTLANNYFNIDNVTKEYLQYWQEVKAEIKKM